MVAGSSPVNLPEKSIVTLNQLQQKIFLRQLVCYISQTSIQRICIISKWPLESFLAGNNSLSSPEQDINRDRGAGGGALGGL